MAAFSRHWHGSTQQALAWQQGCSYATPWPLSEIVGPCLKLYMGVLAQHQVQQDPDTAAAAWTAACQVSAKTGAYMLAVSKLLSVRQSHLRRCCLMWGLPAGRAPAEGLRCRPPFRIAA